jgi:hypoxanthine phosphoribosyltransferase
MDPQPRLHPTTPGRAALRPGPGDVAFAHASEAELARILDFYGVGWEYEPRTFPLMWNLRGEVVESFTPDFFLPELDLYVELTTLRQKLVRKKNRKLRRMRELYPDVRVKLLYGKDFRALLLKFGRIGLADAFSGTVGQTTPPRDAGTTTPARTDGPADARGQARAGDAARRGGRPQPTATTATRGAEAAETASEGATGAVDDAAPRAARARRAARRSQARRGAADPAAAVERASSGGAAGRGAPAPRPRTAE